MIHFSLSFCRFVAWTTLRLVLIALVGGMLCHQIARTPEGEQALADGFSRAVRLLSADAIQVGRVHVDLSGRVAVDALDVGPVQVRALALGLDLARLADGEVRVLELSAARVTVRPSASATPPSTAPLALPTALPALPALPGWLPDVRVDHLSVARLEIATAPALALHASAEVRPRDLSLAVHARGSTLDGPRRRFRADLTRAPGAPARFNVALEDQRVASAHLAGTAGIDAASAELALQVPGVHFVGRADAGYARALSVRVSGRVTGPAQVDLVLSARQLSATRIDLDVRAAALESTVSTTAALDLAASYATGYASVALALSPLAARAGVAPLAGRVDVAGSWSAAPGAFTAALDLAAAGVATGPVVLDAHTRLNLEAAGGHVDLQGQGKIARLDVNRAALFDPAHPAALTLKAGRGAAGTGHVEVALADPDASLELSAREAGGGVDAQVACDARALGRRALLRGLGQAAAVALDARVTARPEAGAQRLTWDARASSAGIVPGVAGAVLARGVTLEGSAELGASVNARLVAHTKPLPDLGAARLEAAVAGTPADLSFDVKVALDHLRAAAARLTALDARAHGRAVQRDVRAELELGATVHAAKEVRARVTGALHAIPTGALSLERLKATLAGATIEGRIDRAAGAALPTAMITGKSDDVAPLLALAGIVARGAAEFEAQLDHQATGPRLNAQALVTKVAAGAGTIERARVVASVARLTSEPTIEASVLVEGAATPEATVARLSVRAAGTPAALAVTLDGQGAAGRPARPLALHTAARLGHLAATTQVDLRELTARFADLPIRLVRPVVMSFGAERIRVPALALTVAKDATLDLDLETTGRRIAASLLVDHVPLALAGPALGGEAGAAVRIDGTLAAPRIGFKVRGRRLRAHDQVPPVDVRIDGGLAGGTLESSVQIAGLTSAPVTASATAPVSLSFAPFAARLDPQGALQGSVQVRAELARLIKVLGLDLPALRGALALDARVTGTPAAPAIAGLGRLTGGHLENPSTGTVLTRVEAEVRANGDRIELKRLTASDGKNGTLDARGTVVLSAPHQPIDLSIALSNMRLLRHDLVSVQSGGALALKGDRRGLRLSGNLDLGEVIATITRHLPPDAAVVPYELVDAPAQTAPAPATPPIPVELDVAVKLTRPAKVSGEGLESEWIGALDVRGPATRPDLVGTLRLKQGQMDILGRTLAMQKGTLTFAGGMPPIPEVDLIVQTDVGGKLVGVHVEGPATTPRIALTSEPAMPDDEIVSQILFRQSIGSISPLQAVMLAKATYELTHGTSAGPSMLDRGRAALALDRLDIGSDKLGLGKYVSEGVFVSVEKLPGTESGQVAVEAALKNGFTLESKVDARSQGSLGLSWSRDY